MHVIDTSPISSTCRQLISRMNQTSLWLLPGKMIRQKGGLLHDSCMTAWDNLAWIKWLGCHEVSWIGGIRDHCFGWMSTYICGQCSAILYASLIFLMSSMAKLAWYAYDLHDVISWMQSYISFMVHHCVYICFTYTRRGYMGIQTVEIFMNVPSPGEWKYTLALQIETLSWR